MEITITIDPIVEFKKELFTIKDPYYLGIVAEALEKVPQYFWTAPASSSGKYHPKSSLGIGGLVRHVKSVFWVSEELLRHPLYAPFTDTEKDEIRVAILLHDTCKQGTENTGTHTVVEHPLLVRDLLNPFDSMDYVCSPDLTEEQKEKDIATWSRICDLIETHMGPWTDDKKTGKKVLNVPTTPGQLFVHLCDFIASRKIIEVDVLDRSAQANYPVATDEPATDKQIDYVKLLMQKCITGNIASPVSEIKLTDETGKVIYTKAQASDDIAKLKKALGIA